MRSTATSTARNRWRAPPSSSPALATSATAATAHARSADHGNQSGVGIHRRRQRLQQRHAGGIQRTLQHVLGTVPQHHLPHRRQSRIPDQRSLGLLRLLQWRWRCHRIAGERGKGYYSWDVGDWHFIALNSNISMVVGSPQETLAAQQPGCQHQTLYRRGLSSPHHQPGQLHRHAAVARCGMRYMTTKPTSYWSATITTISATARPTAISWRRRRPAPDPDRYRRPWFLRAQRHASAAGKQQRHYFGVLKLTLTAANYQADFVPVAGSTFTDTVSAACNNANGPQPDFTISVQPPSASLAPGCSTQMTSRSPASAASRPP